MARTKQTARPPHQNLIAASLGAVRVHNVPALHSLLEHANDRVKRRALDAAVTAEPVSEPIIVELVRSLGPLTDEAFVSIARAVPVPGERLARALVNNDGVNEIDSYKAHLYIVRCLEVIDDDDDDYTCVYHLDAMAQCKRQRRE